MKINDLDPNNLTEIEVAQLETLCTWWRRNNQRIDATVDEAELVQTTAQPVATAPQKPEIDMDGKIFLTSRQMESVIGLTHSSLRHLTAKYPKMARYFQYIPEIQKWSVDEREFLGDFPEETRALKSGKKVAHPLWWPTSVANKYIRSAGYGKLRYGPSTYGTYGANVMRFDPPSDSGGTQAYYLTDIRAWKKNRPTLYNACVKSLS